ncbi:hypothetical protein DSAG12_01156 [Promethearchaeum syntrophicum]|uniref:Uncharacterized protein n=1 Tax=Promethearchaeum syntrophicum TaxID=2594042 RepID=A0A5B9D8J6_9ARCH|nr:hypothetical protein [Candidatus Prometheoarchaeum syntrophicum]QEE15331.1 hypothetical protein DSAG12_01156 [Candidatus Prometheoarchaeum syntrophicum]
MTGKTIRFYCEYCKETLAIQVTESLEKEFKERADKWPYPLVYHHSDHFAIIYIDENWHERGVVCSKISYKKET